MHHLATVILVHKHQNNDLRLFPSPKAMDQPIHQPFTSIATHYTIQSAIDELEKKRIRCSKDGMDQLLAAEELVDAREGRRSCSSRSGREGGFVRLILH